MNEVIGIGFDKTIKERIACFQGFLPYSSRWEQFEGMKKNMKQTLTNQWWNGRLSGQEFDVLMTRIHEYSFK